MGPIQSNPASNMAAVYCVVDPEMGVNVKFSTSSNQAKAVGYNISYTHDARVLVGSNSTQLNQDTVGS
jgi:hypothetical protein